MELRDYLKVIRRRWLILVIVPLVALVGTVGYLASKARTYDDTATVAAPALVGGSANNTYSGSDGPKAFVANFTAMAASPQVVNYCVSQTKVKKDSLQAGTVVAQVGTSSIVTVTATLAKKADVEPVALCVARDTLSELFTTQRNLALGPLQAAQKKVAADNTAIANYVASINDPVPDQDYNVLATTISQLEQTQVQDAASGLTAASAAVAKAIATYQAEKNTLGSEVAQYDQLTAQRTQDQGLLNQLQTTYDSANAQYLAAGLGGGTSKNNVVTINGDVHKVSLTSTVPIKAGSALVGGLILAIALVIFVELLARRRAEQEQEQAQAAGASVSGGATGGGATGGGTTGGGTTGTDQYPVDMVLGDDGRQVTTTPAPNGAGVGEPASEQAGAAGS